MKYVALLFTALLFSAGTYASCSSVPPAIRDDYASGMFDAFVTQSYGKSTIAFYQFDVAREKAKKAGENPLRLIAIEQLFAWYRMYANSLNLYHKRPTGKTASLGNINPHMLLARSVHDINLNGEIAPNRQGSCETLCSE